MSDSKSSIPPKRNSVGHSLLELSRSRVDARESEPSRTWDPREWEEDKRYVEALDLLTAGHKRDAFKKLESLYDDDPGHLYGRAQLLNVAIELREEEAVREHIEWAVSFHAKQGRPESAASSYRAAREAFPELTWNEKPLIQVLVSADKVGDHVVVVDVTKQLLRHYPQSASMPRALYASASAQLSQERLDLALKTLQGIVDRYPLDPLADMADRKIRELTGRKTGSIPLPSLYPSPASDSSAPGTDPGQSPSSAPVTRRFSRPPTE